MMRRLAAVVVVALLAVPAVAADVSEEDLDQARTRLEQAQAEANDLAARLEDAYVRQLALDEEITSLEQAMESTEARLVESEAAVQELAVQMYMGASTSVSLSVILGSSDETVTAGLEYVRRVTGAEDTSLNRYKAVRAELDRQVARLQEARAEQTQVADELQTLTEQAEATLASASADFQALEAERQRQLEEERRRREAELAAQRAATSTTTTTAASPATASDDSGEDDSGEDDSGEDDGAEEEPETTTTTAPPPPEPPPPTGASACPVAGPVSFIDSWGAPRSGGRGHQGVDMMAAHGTPVAAIFDGTISTMRTGGLGGITLWMHSSDGDSFYYAHLQGYAGGIGEGTSVSAGQIIAYVGSTGNASPSYPHLHFEHHPGGGSAINPYPLVRGICG